MPFTPEEFRRRFGPKSPTTSPFHQNLLWAYQTAKEVVKHPEIVEPALYKQAYGYVKAGTGIEASGLGETATSRELYKQKYKFAGWSRGVRTGLAQQGLAPGQEGFVQAWQKLALPERLTKAVEHGPYGDVPLEGFYKDISWTAKKYGVQSELASKLGSRAPQMLQDLLNPPTLWQKMRRGAGAAQEAMAGKGPKIAAGGAALFLGLYLAKPLSLFSGKDDEYNTIEGLSHRGLAGQNRRFSTDFGSGWRGLLRHKKLIGFSAAGIGIGGIGIYGGVKGYNWWEARQQAERERITGIKRRIGGFGSALNKFGEVGENRYKRILIDKSKLSKQDLSDAGFISTIFSVPERGMDSLISYENPDNRFHFFSHDDFWSMHKDKYPTVKTTAKRILFDETRRPFTEAFRSAAHVVTEGIPSMYGFLFPGKDDAYNTIEGLSHRGMAGQTKSTNTDFGSGYQGDKSYERDVRERFGFFTRALREYGKELGTGHKRIYIPKTAISREQLEDVLGFVPVSVAIPEAGQVTNISYRHPSKLFHLHEFPKAWTMHEDEHAAFTMLLLKQKQEKEKDPLIEHPSFIENLLTGIPHILTEGVPGAYYYIKGQIVGTTPMIERLRENVSDEYKSMVSRFEEIEQPSLLKSLLNLKTSLVGKGLSEIKSSIFSGFDDTYNTIEGLSHRGISGQLRRENTDFGSGAIREKILERAVQLFRGTSRQIRGHTGGFFAKGLKGHRKTVEEFLEAVRVREFADRPSRLTSSFWSPHSKEAVDYAKMGSFADPKSQGAFVSFTQSSKSTFFTDQEIYSSLSALKRTSKFEQKRLEYARAYWKGMTPEEALRTPTSEALLPGTVVPDKIVRLNSFSGFDDAYNTIEGLSHRGASGVSRKLNTDFGSGWRGLFSKLAKPFTFAGKAERAYKGLLKQSLKSQGVSTRGLKWDYVGITEGGTLDLTLMARNRANQPLAMITRSLGPKEAYLTSIEVATQGTGLGKQIYSREAQVLRRLGYKEGTRVTSPISSPITARWQAQLYGSRPVKQVPEDFLSRLIGKDVRKEEFQRTAAGEFVGELRFDGFVEQGVAAAQRKGVGFGSGAISGFFKGFAKRIFRQGGVRTSVADTVAFEQRFLKWDSKDISKLTALKGKGEVSFTGADVFSRKANLFSLKRSQKAAGDFLDPMEAMVRPLGPSPEHVGYKVYHKMNVRSLSSAQEAHFQRLTKFTRSDIAQMFGQGSKEIGQIELGKAPVEEIYKKMGFRLPGQDVKELLTRLERDNLTISGQAAAKRKTSMMATHVTGVKQASSYSLRPGRGHTSMSKTSA